MTVILTLFSDTDEEAGLGDGVVEVAQTRTLKDVVEDGNVLQGQLVVSSLQFAQSCTA